jgi:hypothetical protein
MITGEHLDMKVNTDEGPVLPNATNPAPPGADILLITVDFGVDPTRSPSWMPEHQFIQKWGEFQFVAEYDGKKDVKMLDADAVRRLLPKPPEPPAPRITKRSTK